jgi:FtsH-binding integral membrane protein
MDTPSYTDANRRATLMVVRIVWSALVLGQLGFGVVVYLTLQSGSMSQQYQPHLAPQMLAIAIAVLVGAMGLGYFVRNQAYKKHWCEHAVGPPGFFMGNLILLALLEGASFVTFVFVLMTGQLLPMILPAVASLAVQAVNFPSGLPMQSSPPDFTQAPRRCP